MTTDFPICLNLGHRFVFAYTVRFFEDAPVRSLLSFFTSLRSTWMTDSILCLDDIEFFLHSTYIDLYKRVCSGIRILLISTRCVRWLFTLWVQSNFKVRVIVSKSLMDHWAISVAWPYDKNLMCVARTTDNSSQRDGTLQNSLLFISAKEKTLPVIRAESIFSQETAKVCACNVGQDRDRDPRYHCPLHLTTRSKHTQHWNEALMMHRSATIIATHVLRLIHVRSLHRLTVMSATSSWSAKYRVDTRVVSTSNCTSPRRRSHWHAIEIRISEYQSVHWRYDTNMISKSNLQSKKNQTWWRIVMKLYAFKLNRIWRWSRPTTENMDALLVTVNAVKKSSAI